MSERHKFVKGHAHLITFAVVGWGMCSPEGGARKGYLNAGPFAKPTWQDHNAHNSAHSESV